MREVVIVLAISLFSAHSQVVPCLYSSGDLPAYTVVYNCEKSPCLVPQHESLRVDMAFTAAHPIEFMTTLATAYIRVKEHLKSIPYDLIDISDTCAHLTKAKCPVNEGQIVMYSLRVPVKPFIPVGSTAYLEFTVEDQHKMPLICIAIEVKADTPKLTFPTVPKYRVE